MDSADDLVLKLVLLKCGWAGREAWQQALEERRRSQGRKSLTTLLRENGTLTPEQAREVVDPLRRREFLKQLVEAEKRFWEHPPARLGGYPLEGVGARGGRAVIFRGTRDGSPVAVKVLSQAHAFDLEEIARFHKQREFGMLLDHPNLIRVLEAGQEGAIPFLVMQWVEGEPLSHTLDEGKSLSAEALADVFIQAARGMAHAHEKGVLHKDLKPDNILVAPGGLALVSDFGVAQRFGEAVDEGAIVGTPAYMSPEQASGETAGLDTRADIFSLGAALYECLTGTQPYQGEGKRKVLEAAAQGGYKRPGRLNPGIPAALEAVVLKAMAKRPADRYPSMRALAEDLSRWREGKPVEATQPGRSWLGRVFGG